MAISSGLGSSALLPAGLGFRNKIINGDFGINQRAFTSTTTSGTYGFDRWAMFTNDGTTTYSAQTFTTGDSLNGVTPKNYARIATSSQTSVAAISLFVQRIEDVRNCAGQTATVSFWARAASGTPKVALEIAQNFGTGGTSETYSYGGQVTLSTSWVRYVMTIQIPSIAGKTIGTENTHSLGMFFWTSAGSNYNSRTGSLGIQNNTIDFWGVQVEQNTQPTPFEQRPIGIELALCQRYYYAASFSDPNFFDAYQASTSYVTWWHTMPQVMRVKPPTVSYGIGGFANVANFVCSALNSNTLHIYAQASSTGRIYFYVAGISASAEL